MKRLINYDGSKVYSSLALELSQEKMGDIVLQSNAAERERDEARAALEEIAGAVLGRDDLTPHEAAQADKSVKPRCERCGNEIDPTTCWCGAFMENHGIGEGGHSAIPMGCDCGRAEIDKARGGK